jgi:two-component system NtrC family sensor kinase
MQKVAIIFIIAILYALTAHLSFFLAAPHTLVSPVWPPAGIALAAVLIFGNVALIGVFIGCFIANSHMFLENGLTFISILFMLVPATGSIIQAYAGKLALIKFIGSYNIFQNTKSILIFILISAFGACLINASISTSLLVLIGRVPLTDALPQWLTWWIADAVGVVAITSIIIAWTAYWKIKVSARKFFNLIITWLCILFAAAITIPSDIELSYIYIPFAIWAAFQFDIRLSLLTGLLISIVCLFDSVHSSYHIQTALSVNTSISLMQLFITIIYLTILLIHAILSDREKAYDNLQLFNVQLEKLVLDRTSDLFDSNKQLEIEKNKAIEAFEALKQSHARLMQSEKMASLGMLTAGVAHEIKHPLNATTANMESIQKILEQFSETINQSSLDENIKNDFHPIQENINSLIAASHVGIKRTAGVIADLCAFARSDELEMVMTDVNRNIDSTLNLLSSEFKSNITIVKEYGDIPALLCHPGKINQVIMNILVNALHALQTRRDSKIIIKTESINQSITISIKDNGPGMKKEVLDKLFTPFMTTKVEGMGSGLGLFLSNNIIKEHHGKIKVTSELDQGTEFVITLPIQEE